MDTFNDNPDDYRAYVKRRADINNQNNFENQWTRMAEQVFNAKKAHFES